MSSCAYLTILILFVTVSGLLGDTENGSDVKQALESPSENFGACGEVHIEKQFTLRSPNYPENYPVDSKCYYLLKGPHCLTHYQFEFLNFSLDTSEGCTKDRFVVEDQDVLCGTQNETKTYLAEKGSLHLRFETSEGSSGTGYLIQVTRMPCEKPVDVAVEESVTEDSMETTTYETTENTIIPIEPRIFLPKMEDKRPLCCGTIHNSKNFLITSPNFPYSSNKRTDCAIEIHRTNDNVCRLRLNFHFFWLGYTDRNTCPNGFLEIDGKLICGCNTELKLTATFGDSNVKTLRFKSEGYYQSYNTGFLIEVTQDKCPKKYSPEESHYGIYNDEINRVAWPSGSHSFIEKLQLINERTEILDDDEDVLYRNKPKIIKSFYVFAPPEYNDIPSLSLDREGTNYLDTSSISTILTNSNYFQCLNWNQMQLHVLRERYGNKLECPREEDNLGNSVEERKCVDLSYVKGYFRSPGYPCFYPGNLNICYRLRKQPGYCKIKMFVQDFQIENSFNCMKDYFLLGNGKKYCGRTLNKASWIIDLRDKDHEDMTFVTDGYYCSRGFSGVYQQITCQDDLPDHPVDTTTPVVITTTPRYDYCDQIISEKSFTMEVTEDHRACTFRINRYNEDVCKINFYFEKFDLLCGVEWLTIDGTMYCGQLTGRTVKVNVNNSSLSIVYKSTLAKKNDNVRFRIQGEQITDDCLIVNDPEVQRLVSAQLKAIDLTSGNLLEEDKDVEIDSKYLVAFVNKNFKDICGIVSNSTTKELPSSFCNILTKDLNVTKCVPLPPKILSDVPYEKKMVAVELDSMKELEELEINEIDCDNLPL